MGNSTWVTSKLVAGAGLRALELAAPALGLVSIPPGGRPRTPLGAAGG